MYTKFGYSIYREVIGYYMGEENAYGAFIASSLFEVTAVNGSHSFLERFRILFVCTCADMRKALSRDVQKKSIIPLPHPVHPGEFD